MGGPRLIETHPVAPAELNRLAIGLFQRWQNDEHTFWLDSGCDTERLGRYSFLGTRPWARVVFDGARTMLLTHGRAKDLGGDPLVALQELARPILQSAPLHGEIPFTGGLVGHVSYDLGLRLAGVQSRHRGDPDLPYLLFGLYDTLICIDHREGLVHLIAARGALHGDSERAARQLAWLRDEVAAVRSLPVEEPYGSGTRVRWRGDGEGLYAPLRADFTRSEYLATIARIQEAIAQGHIEQVNLAQRFQAATRLSGSDLYRRLRTASPAPFGAALRVGRHWILSSSPERLFKVQHGQVETRPIKGTRPRSMDAEADARLRRDLAEHPKDRAEHEMIVALAEDELAQVCVPGTVHVPERMTVEAYRTVYQLVSTVRGRLQPGKDAVDCLRALFPGASITGRPKREALEMIDALEPVGRGIYTGAVGYLGMGGNADFNVTIRTILLADGVASFHVGGAIVADSVPAAEYEETLDKAEGMVQALFAEEAAS